jgi:AcrR family transcriptional regulator
MDARAERSRAALMAAFLQLVLRHRYGAISVDRLIREAGVARSTFYEHFSGKDELLVASLRGPFRPLADAVRQDASLAALEAILQHFWVNRALAPSIFAGATGKRASGVLVAMIEERLRSDGPLSVPPALLALQIAGLQLTAVGAWLDGTQVCSARDLALAIARASAGAAAALRIDRRAQA